MLIPLPSFSPDHLHPILVNFTAALLPASLASDVFGRVFRKRSLHEAAGWMLIYGTAITPFTAFAGWMWKRSVEKALPPSVINMHQQLGVSLALLFIGLACWRWSLYTRGEAPGTSYLIFALGVVAALAYQGSLGGGMVFGS